MEQAACIYFVAELKKLQKKKEVTHQAYLQALTCVKPFDEIKELYLKLQSIESEINTAQTMIQLNVVEIN